MPRLLGSIIALLVACNEPAARVEPPAPPAPTDPAPATPPAFSGAQSPIPKSIAATMREHSWHPGCPLPLEGLSYLRLNHWGYDGEVHEGELVVDATVAVEVLEIFRELFSAKFPIEKIRLIGAYQGSDDRSMADNNTSAFNCRFKTGSTKVFSKHSWGRAIDINPLTNPYVGKRGVQPPGGQAHVDRTEPAVGLIFGSGAVVEAFRTRGWRWGGTWRRVKDYQHFEKPMAE